MVYSEFSCNYEKDYTSKLIKINECEILNRIREYFKVIKKINDSIVKVRKTKLSFICTSDNCRSIIEKMIRIETLAMILQPKYNYVEIDDEYLCKFLNNDDTIIKLIYVDINNSKKDYVYICIDGDNK